jgi:hypothetical protein
MNVAHELLPEGAREIKNAPLDGDKKMNRDFDPHGETGLNGILPI